VPESHKKFMTINLIFSTIIITPHPPQMSLVHGRNKCFVGRCYCIKISDPCVTGPNVIIFKDLSRRTQFFTKLHMQKLLHFPSNIVNLGDSMKGEVGWPMGNSTCNRKGQYNERELIFFLKIYNFCFVSLKIMKFDKCAHYFVEAFLTISKA
jgi:hypothetical protein